MRKLILRSFAMTLVMCFLSLASIAQSGDQKRDRKPMDVEQRLEKMTESLNLTDRQIPQIKAILVKYADQMKALQETRDENSGEKRGAMKEQMKALKTAQKEELSLVLTDEQNQKMEEQLEKRAQRKGERKSGKEGR